MELISLVRQKKCKEAIELIKGGSDLEYVNENGCTCLHFASSEGLSEIIVAAAQHGVDMEQRDEDGETALFKAVKHSNIESVVALVAFNATIYVVNNKGQSLLDIAVAKKDTAVVELLCSLGSSVTIDDWTVGGVDVNILSKEDQNIMRILINRLELEAENNYGDVYEIQTWGNTPTCLKLDISVLGFVEENELVVIMPLEGFVEGNISGQSFTDGEHPEEVVEKL
ncbi:uncharacterized protein [Mytilus edulis]|uniref:uncharacterized protein n=1 Tax=Mytilus edulis TaxID=6550 RepID=UPI0039EF4135